MEEHKMKRPIPIDSEIELDPKRYIVSETDKNGKITYCNDYFINMRLYKRRVNL